MKLNLGCSAKYTEGWTNVDIDKTIKADVYHDLNIFPYPFGKNSVEEVRLFNVWEHLKYVYEILDELYRICKLNAVIHIKVPHATRNLSEPETPIPFSFSKIIFLLNEKRNKDKFELILMRFNDGLHTASFLGVIVGRIKAWLFNLAPMFMERNFIYLFGGIEELEFKLRVKSLYV